MHSPMLPPDVWRGIFPGPAWVPLGGWCTEPAWAIREPLYLLELTALVSQSAGFLECITSYIYPVTILLPVHDEPAWG